MDFVLSRRKNYLQLLSGIFSPVIVVTVACFQVPSMASAVLFIAIPVFLISTVVSLKYGLKPAAWISDGALYIRDGIFSVESIPLDKVESMEYETGIIDTRRHETEMHLIRVKMSGFSEWEIPVRDMIDHGKDLRLYQFIQQYFYPLSLIKPDDE